MSDTGGVQQKAYDPNKKEPEKEPIKIPAWWSVVALIIAGLVFLPIQYANIHSKKPVAQEEPGAKQAENPGPANAEAPQSKQNVEKAEQAKPAPEPALEAKQAEKPGPATAEAPQSKPDVEKAEQAKPAPEPAPEAKQAENPGPATAEAPQSKQDVEKAEQAKPAPEPALEAKQAEKPGPATAEAPQSKQDIAIAEQAKPAPEQALEQKAAPVKAPGEKQKVEDAIYYRIDGKDKQGREAAFAFIVLTNGYAWAKGSSSAVLFGGKAIPDAGRLFAPKVRESLARARDVIAVGLATDEGKRAEEEARALARSKTVAAWIKKVVKPGIPLWTLTLGQFEKACKTQEDKDLNFNQPVLFIGVQSKAEGANLQEALADAIGGRANFPGRECYSRFDLLKVR
jgi:hypothetical protein